MYYPKNRRKKIPHEQYMLYDKVVNRGQKLDFYTMIYDKGWWACKRSSSGSLFKHLKVPTFLAIAKVPYYMGYQYDKVLGYVAIITSVCKRPYNYKFVFVKEAFCAANEINKAVRSMYPRKKTGRPFGTGKGHVRVYKKILKKPKNETYYKKVISDKERYDRERDMAGIRGK